MATIDPKTAKVAMQAAVSRWKRFPDDPIEKQLDEADECVQEASLMNKFLPPFMAQRQFAWKFIVAQDIFRAGIKTVRMYAGLVYLHMSPATTEAVLPNLDAASMADGLEAADTGEPAPSKDQTHAFFANAMSEHERQGII
ncbi:MAG TPA: hypothetical protein VGQ36_28015 [Thermoanaerobaculia bacterium]|jgi:hypothetical protein|nr:hypothetical protein [Thermoanaerobaculia bacterium]